MPDVEIPEHIAKRLQEARKPKKGVARPFEPWQDKVLLECWMHPNYRQPDVSRIIGRGEHQCRRRYRELMSAEQADKSEPTAGTDSRDPKGVQPGRSEASRFYRESHKDGAA